VSGELKTRETVAGDTPAPFETSRIVEECKGSKAARSEIDFSLSEWRDDYVTALPWALPLAPAQASRDDKWLSPTNLQDI
jgi:hypothetical protein